MKFAIFQNKFSFVAAVLAFVAELGYQTQWRHIDQTIKMLTDPSYESSRWVTVILLIFNVAELAGLVLLCYIAMRKFEAKSMFWLIFILWLLANVANLVVVEVYYALNGMNYLLEQLKWMYFPFLSPAFSLEIMDVWAWIELFCRWIWIASPIFALIGVLNYRKETRVELFDTPATSGIQPQKTPDGLRYSSMPLVAFILAFFSPLVAIILAYVSLSQMKYGQVSRVNEGQAKTALILGWVFFGLSILVGIIWGIIAGVAASHSSYY